MGAKESRIGFLSYDEAVKRGKAEKQVTKSTLVALA